MTLSIALFARASILFALVACGTSDESPSEDPATAVTAAPAVLTEVRDPTAGTVPETDSPSPAEIIDPEALEPEAPPDPCASPAIEQVEAVQGRWVETSLGLDFRFVGTGTRRPARGYRGSSLNLIFYDLRSRHGERVREHHISGGEWRRPRNHGGICFRGARQARYETRRPAIEVAPNCDDEGNLVTRGCRGVF